ncbi:phosphatidylinositol-4-phosphate 5-kinase, putative [Bodo saltans]|uniref:Phosphatidylinositol-4-phosphate 5-kinase, putative n=1 Tax=Bodo saltans TaxID=75058 RepID=A0A0S4IZ82_BODSA|nr:phosphatidylinositol-4-phosphate 5-kinase, putative [Bodo saltans]|eukprot:CUG63963.1 phosphatidylinositol-4-phosphate 5-kinase, putative [Bodo saltans]
MLVQYEVTKFNQFPGSSRRTLSYTAVASARDATKEPIREPSAKGTTSSEFKNLVAAWSPSTTPTPPIPQGGDEDQFCAVPSIYADAMLSNTTTIEDLLFDMNRGDSPQPHQRCQSAVPSSCVDASHSEVTTDTRTATISPSVNMMDNSETMSQTFVRDQFRREDEAIDVLSGKSTQQASSFKYVIRDLVMPAEATKPNNIVVEVMFPHQFAAMRYLYARDLFARESSDEYSSSAPQGSNGSAATLTEDGIISSLLRCKLYNAQGGKSGAGFFITQDERLMLKKIKLTELRHFVQFAPQYFEHMVQLCMHVQHQKRAQMRRPASACTSEGGEGDMHAHDDQAASGGDDPSGEPTDCSLGDYSSFSTDEVPPSALSKIFGVFSISFKKTRGPFAQSEVRYYMLTENIMYRRPVELSYDLKGSQLNRHAAEGSHVLLDQDLVRETKKGFFFYCRESSRARVVDALTNDAQRLCAASIMDYSAIVSVDKRSETLAFGVIDYLHPYTGAKVLESKVKGGIENMFGQGRDPTIIDPHHYKQRFLRWMDSYLCGVPDKIAQLKKRAVTVVSPHDDEAEGSSFDDKWRVPRRADIPQTRVVRMLQGGALVQLEDVEYRVV